MKNYIKSIAAFAALAAIVACNPIEDQSLRSKYVTNAGDPMTSEELSKHLKVTQPGETNDLVVVENDDPTIGGVWHFTTATGEYILKSDKGSYTYTSNNDFEVYMVAPSAGKLVESKHFKITVTDVYDPWVGMLTGAQDNKDKSAKKTWGFRPVTGAGADTDDPSGYICAMSAYGFWKWFAPTTVTGQAWWGQTTFASAGDQTMVFEYSGQKMITYDAAGNVVGTGGFAVDHNSPDPGIEAGTGVSAPGTFTASAPVIGAEFNDYGPSGAAKFLILEINEKNLTLFYYPSYPGPNWDDAGWILYTKAK